MTHQLVEIRLLQRSECGDPAQLDDTVLQLQQRITRQLLLDPRVVDAYMQRVLMLVESGAGALAKPIWIWKLVDAQQPDGGWSTFEPLLPLGGRPLFWVRAEIFLRQTTSFRFSYDGPGGFVAQPIDQPLSSLSS